jgi:hypothetical protein
MTRLNYEHQAFTIPIASQPDPEPARRLIVLVPSLEVDLIVVTQRVWELANATGAHVKFISLCNDAAQEPSLRRELATMSAIVKDGNISAEAEVVSGRNWVEVVKTRRQAGDIVVCCAEQRAGLMQRPLSQILQSDLDMPLYILTGLYSQNVSHSNRLTQIFAWIGFIAIIVGFFLLQVKIDQLAKDWTTVLQLLTTAIEFWLIWVWNNLFG